MSESSNTDNQIEVIEPVNIERQVAIWKWLLNPRGNQLPAGVVKEELVGVFHHNLSALLRFKEISEQIGATYEKFN